ncbi:FeoA family protein [Caproicibacterium sp. BJN0003]|uniref:FeoA family protein n=1 Tax=Caproicibacterium sp. BJN0003 TaxID=2994078 RepID=UPI0022570933|nr:ferrous iron transport protein A [Caproicibacterium sp. BJN0003]UZT83009.1 ferrous iron transport protein A [Caproicibacterium sp. BJN0003]
MKLNELPIGKEAIIKEVQGKGALRRHMLDMGLTPHTQVKIQKVAPMGDPIELTLRGYELTLRVDDAKNVIVQEVGK